MCVNAVPPIFAEGSHPGPHECSPNRNLSTIRTILRRNNGRTHRRLAYELGTGIAQRPCSTRWHYRFAPPTGSLRTPRASTHLLTAVFRICFIGIDYRAKKGRCQGWKMRTMIVTGAPAVPPAGHPARTLADYPAVQPLPPTDHQHNAGRSARRSIPHQPADKPRVGDHPHGRSARLRYLHQVKTDHLRATLPDR